METLVRYIRIVSVVPVEIRSVSVVPVNVSSNVSVVAVEMLIAKCQQYLRSGRLRDGTHSKRPPRRVCANSDDVCS